MELYFLRHGKADDPGSRGGSDDFSRALTRKGIEEMQAEAEGLAQLGVRLDLILTSPLVRARQTAEVVAKRLGLKKELAETELLAPGCDLSKLHKMLEQHAKRDKIMLVGHEPDFSAMVGELIGGGAASVEMKKAGLAMIRVDRSVRPGGGVLRWLLSPRILRACGGDSNASEDSRL